MIQHEVLNNTINLDELFNRGFCFDLTIRTWQAKSSDKSILSDIPDLKDGYIKFLSDNDKKSFRQYEVKARLWLEQNSFPFMNTRFVPNEAFKLLINGDDDRVGLLKLKECFYNSFNEFINNFDQTKTNFIESIRNTNPKQAESIEWSYPSKEEVASKFFFDWNTYEISPTSQVGNKEIMDQSANQHYQAFKNILINKISDSLANFKKMIYSENTVKSSSIRAMKNAIINYHSMNIFDETELDKKLLELHSSLSTITNIESENTDMRNKIADIVDGIL
jgi:hypothetical protein